MQISIHSKWFHAIWLFGEDAAPTEEEIEPDSVVHLVGGDFTPVPVEEYEWVDPEEDYLRFGFQPSGPDRGPKGLQ